jgi:AcrR family transcriptional regulator
VVESAQVSRGSIYHHFPEGKAQLGIEVATAWRHELERQVLRFAARANTAEAFVKAYIRYMQNQLLTTDFTAGCPMTGMLVNIGSAESDPVRAEIGATFDAFRQAIAKVFVQKGIEPAEARRLAVTVVSALQGATIVSRATRTVSDFEDLLEMLPVWFDQPESRRSAERCAQQ